MGPARHSEWENSFVHELNLLGEVPCCTDAEREAFERKIHIIGGDSEDAILQKKSYPDINWLTLRADSPNALRFFLAGSHTRYPIDLLDLRVHEEVPGLLRLKENGIPGVLGLQPTFMFDRIQWLSCLEELKGVHQYNMFGSWRASGRRDGQTIKAREKHGRGAAIRAINQARSDSSQSRRKELLTAALSLQGQASSARTGRRGRPARRKWLGEALAKQGYKVSERDLKWLQGELHKPHEG